MSVRIILVALLSMLAGPASADSIARPFPKDVLAYAETSPAALMDLVEQWDLDKGRQLDEPLRLLAKLCDMDVDALTGELRKMNRAAAALVRIDPKTEKPVYLGVCDLSGLNALREALSGKLAAWPRNIPAGTGATMYGRGDNAAFGVIVADLFIVGNDLEETMAAVGRVRSREAENLAENGRCRVRVEPQSLLVFFADVALVHRWLTEAEGKNDDFAALDALLDLKTVDQVRGRLDVSDGSGGKRMLLFVDALFRGENRTGAALLGTRLGKPGAAKFFTIDWGVVVLGNLADGPAQAGSLRSIVAKALEADGDRRPLDAFERWEKRLGTKVEDELAAAPEFGFAVRPGAGGSREALVAIQLKDPARAEALARAAQGFAAEGAWSFVAADGFLLFGSNAQVLADALATRESKRCILDERTAKEALMAFPPSLHGFALVNPMRLATRIPRNPNAPPPALIGAAFRISLDSVGLGVDATQMKGLVQVLQRFLAPR